MISDNSVAQYWMCNETWICNEGGAWVTRDVSSVRCASFSFSQGSDLQRVETRSGRARILRTEWLGIVDKWGPWNGKHISGCWLYSGVCRFQVRRAIFCVYLDRNLVRKGWRSPGSDRENLNEGRLLWTTPQLHLDGIIRVCSVIDRLFRCELSCWVNIVSEHLRHSDAVFVWRRVNMTVFNDIV